MKHLILNDLGHVVNLGDRYVHHWLLAGLGQHLFQSTPPGGGRVL